MEGLTYIENILDDPEGLFSYLDEHVNWDESMHSRKTASFGIPYNYSQIEYPYQPFPKVIESIIESIEVKLEFKPNNCLINYYPNGKSTMGWHSDRTDILHDGTGVAIVSIGDTRVLRFREITNKENTMDYPLAPGSIIYMTKEVQDRWHHSIPKADSDIGRMSLTFRKLLSND